MDVPDNAPGIASGIVYNGRIVYKKYAGFANLENNLEIGGESRFNIASNAKQFTALSILILQEKGFLNIDDDIRKYFPELYSEITDSIKIKHLINHSSGIRDVYDLWSLQGITWWKQTFSNKDALELIGKQKELNFKPSSGYLYSNSNYILLSEIIDQVTKEGFHEFTKNLFLSLDMPNTSFTKDFQKIPGLIAKPYFNFNTWTDYKWTCNIVGDGNLFSTLEDQLQWEKIIQLKGNGKISPDIIKQSQNTLSDSSNDLYGYGLEFAEYKENQYAFHAGSTGAWKAFSARFQEGNISFVTLTNSGKTLPSYQTLLMVDSVLKLDEGSDSFLIQPKKVGEHLEIKEVLGIYLTEGGYMMRFKEVGGELFLLRSGRNDLKLLRESSNVFHQWNDEAFKLEFTKDENGTMGVTAYYTTHAPYTLTRLEEDLNGFNYQMLNGEFINIETGATYKIIHLAENQYQIKRGSRELTALLVSPNQLLFDDDKINFMPNSKDEINELFLDYERLQKVRFERR
jgi:CubicO group peptidase (beta-lactamase class C family)